MIMDDFNMYYRLARSMNKQEPSIKRAASMANSKKKKWKNKKRTGDKK